MKNINPKLLIIIAMLLIYSVSMTIAYENAVRGGEICQSFLDQSRRP